MQKSIFLSFIVCLLIVQSTYINAQQENGQIVVNSGVGYSPEFDGNVVIPNIKFNLFNDPYLFNSSYPVAINPINKHMWVCSPITPNMGAIVDYGLLPRLSMGIAGSYQRENIYTFSNVYYDNITRINISARFLYHSSKVNKKFDRYIGFRVGCSYWTDIPPTTPPVYPNLNNHWPEYFINSPHLFIPSFQVFYGVRTYILPNIGVHIELGIGSPYLIEGGLTFRISVRNPIPAQDKIGDKK